MITSQKWLSFAILVILALFAAGGGVRAAQAQASAGFIVVNSGLDESGAAGNCTLREAVIAANENRAVGGCNAGVSTGMDWIRIAPSVTEIVLTLGGPGENQGYGGDLDILGSVMIEGRPGGTAIRVSDTLSDRVFHILAAGGSVMLRNLEINQGRPADVRLGGAIYLQNGALKIENSKFNTDRLRISPGDAPNSGGAIYSSAGTSLDIYFSVFKGNLAGSGGAILNRGYAQVRSSYFTGNQAFNPQGGGGAIYHNSPDQAFVLTNTTLYQNVTDSGAGAEIFNEGPGLTLNNNTIIASGFSSAIYFANYNASLRNTIVFQQIAGGRTCEFFNPSEPPLVSGGYNLENATASGCNFTAPGDQILPANTDVNSVVVLPPDMSHTVPAPVFTGNDYFWLAAGSPAIDAGSGCASSDQRGIFWKRPSDPGAQCDIGSIEVEVLTASLPNQIFLPGIRK